MTELNHLTIAGALDGLAKKEFTSFEITMACLAQMEKHRDLNAFVTETKERAPRWIDVVKRMARLSDISFADSAPDGAVQLLVRGEVAALPLKGVIDVAAERTRLDKEIGKADADIKRAESKLANEKFVANAAEEVVEEEREKREAALARKAKLLEALERLKQAT